jgi:hypothetical protein
VVARIPVQLRRPLLEAFQEFAVEAGDDNGAITVLETAPVIRRQRRGWDHLPVADGPAFYAIHNMLVRLATLGDVIEPTTRRETLALARLARRVADRMRAQLQGKTPGGR